MNIAFVVAEFSSCFVNRRTKLKVANASPVRKWSARSHYSFLWTIVTLLWRFCPEERKNFPRRARLTRMKFLWFFMLLVLSKLRKDVLWRAAAKKGHREYANLQHKFTVKVMSFRFRWRNHERSWKTFFVACHGFITALNRFTCIVHNVVNLFVRQWRACKFKYLETFNLLRFKKREKSFKCDVVHAS